MKFQNSSIHGFKVMLCIKKRDERTDGRTDHGRKVITIAHPEQSSGELKRHCIPVSCSGSATVWFLMSPKTNGVGVSG